MAPFRRVLVAGLALALWAIARPATAQTYRVIEVQLLPGTSEAIFTDLNNSLQAVGYSRIPNGLGGVIGQPFIWDLNGIRPFPLPDVVGPLAINNFGVIAGTQRASTGLRVFSLLGSEYRQLPTPPTTYVEVVEITDSGIIHLRAGDSAATLGSWAIYNSQLYDLRAFGLITAIGEDATIAGFRNGSPYLRSLDGREMAPWAPQVAVSVMGPGGHVAGVDSPFASVCCLFRDPSGVVTQFTSPVTPPGVMFVDLRGINRRGEVLGRVRFPCGSCSPSAFTVFLYRNGQTINLTRLLPVSSDHLIDAQRITDGGAIAATFASGGFNSITFTRQVVLVPDDDDVPEPPSGLIATVTGQHVTLQWNESAGAAEYIVQAGTAPGITDFYNQSVGPQPIVAGVVPRGRYFVRVLARRGLLTSAPSAEFVVDVR